MRYEILGPLHIVTDDEELSLSANKLEILLGTLLIRADQAVPAEQLLSELWGENPPRRARDGLYVYISQLRKMLDGSQRTESPIVTSSCGYTLRLGADEFDLHHFQDAVREGRRQLWKGSANNAAAAFQDALTLWRGPILGGLPGGPIVDGFAVWLEECRLECQELLIDANMRLGRHREMVGLLFSLTTEYPLREAFCQRLMLALYRSGRQADALRVYLHARDVISAELGIEPGQALRDLHKAILIDDNDLIPCST